jgi:hypothetical protein
MDTPDLVAELRANVAYTYMPMAVRQQLQQAADHIEALTKRVAELERVMRGWLEWYNFATSDDDCEYLNGRAWGDAEALASSTMGQIAALQQKDREDG